MEEKEKWYIRGKKGCKEQIRKEFVKRGADDPHLWKMNFDEKTYIYYLVCGLIEVEEDGSILGKRIVKQWNEVTVSEPKPKPMFKPYDKVLVCNTGDTWFATEFSCYNPNDTEHYYRAINNGTYSHCLPYEGNEHLNGVKFKPEHIEGYEWGE